LAIGVMLLAVAAAVSWPVAQRVRLLAIDRELAALKPQADAALKQREQLQRDGERAAAILRLRNGRPPLIGILDALSRSVPDGSWLLSLTISGRDIVLDGLSSSAATLALALERNPMLSGIVFRSPIDRDAASGLEHFQLGATLAETKP
jgi:general secretion pathway protein L